MSIVLREWKLLEINGIYSHRQYIICLIIIAKAVGICFLHIIFIEKGVPAKLASRPPGVRRHKRFGEDETLLQGGFIPPEEVR
jgi:hypothetical protein